MGEGDELAPLGPARVPARRGEDDGGAAPLPRAQHALRLRPEGAHQAREVAAPAAHAVADGCGAHALGRQPDARGRLRARVRAESCHRGRAGTEVAGRDRGSGQGLGVGVDVGVEARRGGSGGAAPRGPGASVRCTHARLRETTTAGSSAAPLGPAER